MKHKEEYLKTGGVFCPFCKDQDIEGRFVDIIGSEAVQEVSCLRCGGAWSDTYKLQAVEAVSDPTE